MARLWSSGFELGSNTSGVEWDGVGGAAATVQAVTVRSGGFAGKILTPATGTAAGWAKQFAGIYNGSIRFYLYVVSRPNVRTTIAAFAQTTVIGTTPSVSGSAFDCTIELNTDGTLTLASLSSGSTRTQFGSASSALSNGQWYRVELTYNGSGAASTATAYLDGTQFATTADTLVSIGDVAFRIGANLNNETCTSGEWYFDDVACNDTTGAAQTGLPGAGSIIHMHPDSAGDFTEGATGAGTGVAWTDVSEVTPDDVTSYWKLVTDVSASSTSADRLDVNCGAFAPANTSVTLVQVGARVMPDTNAACSWVPRIKSQASGTLVEGTTASITGTVWVTNDDTAGAKTYKLTQYTDPQAGGAWTTALLNSMQIGARAPDGAPDVRISTMWALVEYVPSVAAGGYLPLDLAHRPQHQTLLAM